MTADLALASRLNDIDFPAIVSAAFQAESLTLVGRPNIDVDQLKHGGCHVHVELSLSDGSKWLARVHNNLTLQYPDHRAACMRSEYCTMRCLSEMGVNVPLAKQTIRDDVLLIKFLDGEPCSMPIHSGKSPSSPKLISIVRQLAAEYIKISARTFDQIGSLRLPSQLDESAVFESDTSTITYGPRLHEVFNEPEHGKCASFGPFRTNLEYHLAEIDWVMDRVERGLHQLYFPGLEDLPILNYLIHHYLRRLLPCFEELAEVSPCYIKHADDKGDHIMVDDEGLVAGIIDWEWAYTSPAPEAFAAPAALLSPSGLYSGSHELTLLENELVQEYERLGRPDLANYVRGGKVYQRLTRIVNHPPEAPMVRALSEDITTSPKFKSGSTIKALKANDNEALEKELRSLYGIVEGEQDVKVVAEQLRSKQ